MIYLKTPASVHLLPLEHTLHPSVKCYWLTVIWCDMYKLAGTLCKMWTKAKYCDYKSYIQALKMESFLILAWWPSGVRESCVSVCSSQSEAGLDATRASLLPPSFTWGPSQMSWCSEKWAELLDFVGFDFPWSSLDLTVSYPSQNGGSSAEGVKGDQHASLLSGFAKNNQRSPQNLWIFSWY